MRTPYHFRSFENGVTTRQSTVGFATIAAAKAAAEKMDRQTGDKHSVCVSLDPKDPENSPDPIKTGFKVLSDADVEDALRAPVEPEPVVKVEPAKATKKTSKAKK